MTFKRGDRIKVVSLSSEGDNPRYKLGDTGTIVDIEGYNNDNPWIDVQFDGVHKDNEYFTLYAREAELLTEEPKPMNDPVNSPSHYTQGGIECIEAIRASLSVEGFRGYLKGNIEKYLWRYEHKGNRVQDLEKAQWYLNKLVESEKA